MSRSISIISTGFICIFFCVIVFVLIYPVYADEPIADNAKKTDQAESRDGSQQKEFVNYKGLRYETTNKDLKPKGASFIKLKPKSEDDSIAGSPKVFNVEFMDDETPGRKTKKDSDGGPYMKIEKIDDPEKNNILVRKATEKDYKTEVSMGLRTSPYSEIYLGKGFLVDRKDDFNVDPRDNGWRLKFKLDF
jgi:hypothetical protein